MTDIDTPIDRLRAELAQRTAERDEARREACRNDLDVCMGVYTAKEVAADRGWNCIDAKEVQP